jgi:hypothetical protein
VIKGSKTKCQEEALQMFIKKLLVNHFKKGNTEKYGYAKNKPSYDSWKKKKYGNLPQLVLSGRLRESALQATVRGGTIYFNVPSYGDYQIELGRIWNKPSEDELKAIKKAYIEALIAVAKKQCASNHI